MNNILKINYLFLVTLFFVSCNEINEIKELKNSQEGKNYFFDEENRLNQLLIENPDSADIELTQLIQKYPKTVEFLELRSLLYVVGEKFEKAKQDVEQLILLEPWSKESRSGMFEYLDCKILTKGDCGDSIENVYTITVSDDINLGNDSNADTEEWKIDTNFLNGIRKNEYTQ